MSIWEVYRLIKKPTFMYEENQYVDSELKNFGKLFNEGISAVLFVDACLFYYKRFVFTSANITS